MFADYKIITSRWRLQKMVLFFLELRTGMRHCLLTFLHVTFVTKHLRQIVKSGSTGKFTSTASFSVPIVERSSKQ